MTENATFVAHSVNFDYSYIREEFKSLGADFRRQKLCTVRLSRKIFPGYSSYSLGNICNSLGIPLENRHRALGDAAATVLLLQRCLENDKESFVSKSLKKNSKEALLPPGLSREVYEALPEKTGVYYFHDEKGKVIYVGKAVNIKKRIYSHFTGKGTNKLSFINKIVNITYVLSGTELIALLLESHEIKKLYPVYNQAQKQDRGNYILMDYIDRKGLRHLSLARANKSITPIASFRSFEAAREFMFGFIEEFELCPKYCGVQTSQGGCFDYQMKKCKGVCAGEEEVEQYNLRVNKGLQQFEATLDTKIIVDQGREENEQSLVLIENGIYQGFGYFPRAITVDSLEEAKKIIEPYRHNADIQRILRAFTSAGSL